MPAQAGSSASADETRAVLLERARVADSLGRKEEAFQLHSRLRDGDFDVGDRIDVSYEGPLTKKDSLSVQAGRVIHLPEPLGDMTLTGVLRSELRDSISARAAKYFKNEVVNVTPLLRLNVSGAVHTPGFYYARADMPLSDVLMRTGGQDQAADLNNVTIKRGDQVLWTPQDVQAALADGMTLARLNLEPGDEIVVGARSGKNWMLFAQLGVSLLSAFALQALIRR